MVIMLMTSSRTVLYQFVVLASTVLSAEADSDVQLTSEWPLIWGTSAWKMNIHCTIDIVNSYLPTTSSHGFYILLSLDDHATNEITTYWPFDNGDINVENTGGQKEYTISTQVGQYIYPQQRVVNFLVEFVNDELTVYGKWPRGTCYGPFPLASSTTSPLTTYIPGSGNHVSLVTEWPVTQTVWRAKIECTVAVLMNYIPSVPPHGFRIKITLQGHATGNIDAYWPFDDSKIEVVDRGSETEFNVPTQNSIYVFVGEYVYPFIVEFENPAQSYGNWPRGSCSGPFPLDGDEPSTTSVSVTTSQSTITTTSTTISPTTPSSSTTPPSTTTTASTTTTSSQHNMDICVDTISHTGSAYNYEEVLCKSILFYEAQRSGDLDEGTNRVPWRKDSALDDGNDVGLDLSGGWFDAGDYVKFNFPMAASTTLLAWGFTKWSAAYQVSGQHEYFLDSIKWALDYLLKCWKVTEQTLYVQVGHAEIDHDYIGRPEDMPDDMLRPSYAVTATSPGTDAASEMAAAFAAGSLVFSAHDPSYSETLLDNAISLFEFAYNSSKGKYHEVLPVDAVAYKSWDYWDELAWAATMLYKVTNNQVYLDIAHQTSSDHGVNPEWAWSFDWDGKAVGYGILMYELTGDAAIQNQLKSFFTKWTTGQMGQDHQITPDGLVWRAPWGSLRHAANVALAALMAAEIGLWNPTDTEDMRLWAKGQIDYALGDNPNQRSYVVGFGNNPPKQPHHRSSTCEPYPAPCDLERFEDTTRDNYYTLYGALVGGPDQNDNFNDIRTDWITNEVACDYNSGFQSALAGIIHWLTNQV